MPDVGVLNLQIQDNSEQAARGLDDLAAALGRVREAVGTGLKLGGIANQIKKINDAMKTAIPEDSISRLERLASAIAKINESGGLKIGQLKNAVQDSGASGIGENIRQDIESGVSAGFKTVGHHVEETYEQIGEMSSRMGQFNEIVQQTAWSAGNMAENFRAVFQLWNAMRMSFSLGSGQKMPLLSDGSGSDSTGWQYYNPYGETAETGWTQWKDGAIEAEYTISDAMDSVSNRIEGAGQQLLLTSGALEEFEQISSRTEQTWRQIGTSVEDASSGLTGIEAIGHAGNGFEQLSSQVQESSEEVVSFARIWDSATKSFKNIPLTQSDYNQVLETGQAQWERMAEAARSQQALQSQLQSDLAGTSSASNDAASRMSALVSSARELASQNLSGLKSGIVSLISPITSLTSQLWRVAKYRMLRAAIKQVTSAFSEGVQNYYHYSAAIKNGFSTSMDSAATSLQTFKNSIGAAVAPLISELIPYLQTVVNWLVSIINYVNQFISLMTGKSTWSKATDATTKAFGNTTKSAKEASDAVKDLLADWDELNIIQSETSNSGNGGSSGASGTNYTSMFEEVSEFSDKIKAVTDYIKAHFEEIKGIVETIGVALLAWKVSEAFAGVLPTLSTIAGLIAAGAVIAVTWKMTAMFDDEFVKTGDEGWLIMDALTNVIGSTLAGTIVGQVLGGAAGSVTIGLSLVVSAGLTEATRWKTKDEDLRKSLGVLSAIKLAIGTAAMALGFGIATGSGVFGIFAAAALAPVLFTLTAAVAVVVKQMQDAHEIAKQAFAESGEGGISVEEIFKQVQAEYDKAAAGYTVVISAFSGVDKLTANLNDAKSTISELTAVLKGDGKLTQEEADSFNKAWRTVFDSFAGITEDSFKTALAGLNLALSSANEDLRKQAKEQRVTLLMLENNMTEEQARMQADLEAITSKIASGKELTEKESQFYDSYMQDLYDNPVGGLVEAQRKRVDEVTNIDFGDKDHAYDNMVNYLESVKTGAEEATAKIDEALKSEEKAIEELKSQTDTAEKYGYIDSDTAKERMAFFEGLLETYRKKAEEDKQSIDETMQDAYDRVLEQSLGVLYAFNGEHGGEEEYDATAAIDHLLNNTAEIVNYITESGGKIDKELAKALGLDTPATIEGVPGYVDSLVEYIKENYVIKTRDKIEGIMEEQDWHSMTDKQFENLQQALIDSFGTDAVRDAFEHLGIEESEMIVPLRMTVEEEIEEVAVENQTETDTEEVLKELEFADGKTVQLPDIKAEAGMDVDVEEPEFSYFGISTKGGWWHNLADAIFGIDIEPIEEDIVLKPEVVNEDGDFSIEDILGSEGKDIESRIGVKVILREPELSNDTVQNASKGIAGEVQDALTSAKEQVIAEMNANDWTNMTEEEFENLQVALAETFGNEAVREALESLDIQKQEIVIPIVYKPYVDDDDEDFSMEDITGKNSSLTGRHLIRTSDLVAFAGASTESRARGSDTDGGNQEPIEVTINNAEQQSNVQNGVTLGTNNILTTLQSILAVSTALNNKQWTINVSPSSAWGDMNARSSRQREMVSGDYVPGSP